MQSIRFLLLFTMIMRNPANLLSKVISTLNQTSGAGAFNFLFILFINIKFLFNHPWQCFSLYNIDSYLHTFIFLFIKSLILIKKKRLFLVFLDCNYWKYLHIHIFFLKNVQFSMKCIISCLWNVNRTSDLLGSLGSFLILFFFFACIVCATYFLFAWQKLPWNSFYMLFTLHKYWIFILISVSTAYIGYNTTLGVKITQNKQNSNH